jgi:hypothetical protein
VSIITAEDIEKRPPANDLAEIIRTMPGVNLTGSGTSGSYGNNRQIDLRGMGPENTLILIDGKPVNSRQSVRMGRNGERNSRGDTNWVPPGLPRRFAPRNDGEFDRSLIQLICYRGPKISMGGRQCPCWKSSRFLEPTMAIRLNGPP